MGRRRSATPASRDWRDADPCYRGHSRRDVGEPDELEGTQLPGHRGPSCPARDAVSHGHPRDAGPRSPGPEQHQQVPTLWSPGTATSTVASWPPCEPSPRLEGRKGRRRQGGPPMQKKAGYEHPRDRPQVRPNHTQVAPGGLGHAEGRGDRRGGKGAQGHGLARRTCRRTSRNTAAGRVRPRRTRGTRGRGGRGGVGEAREGRIHPGAA